MAKIKLPNRSEYHLDRDPAMNLVSLREFQYVTGPNASKMDSFSIVSTAEGVNQTVTYKDVTKRGMVETRTWLFENDAQGRIKQYINPCKHIYTIEHTYTESDEGETYGMVLRDHTVGTYQWMRHIAAGKTWVYERGHGSESIPLEDAPLDQRVTLKKIGINFRPVKIEAGSDEKTGRIAVTTMEYDEFGHVTGKSLLDKEGHVLKKMNVNRKPSWDPTKEEGLPVGGGASCNQVRFNWDAEGQLSSVVRGAERQDLRFDRLGRMTFAASSLGVAEGWTYDGFNQVVGFARYGQDESGSWEPRTVVGFKTDALGRLTEKRFSSGHCYRYKHECAGVSSYRDEFGISQRFYYYENGRLRKMVKEADAKIAAQHPELSFTQWYHYDGDGRLDQLKEKRPGQQERLMVYEYRNGRRYMKDVEGGDFEGDRVPVISETVTNPLGETERLEYNRFGAVISPLVTTENDQLTDISTQSKRED